MKVFVAGATGGLGRRLVPILVASGHQVVAMTRDRDKARRLLGAQVEQVVGDLDRPETIEAALGGVDRLFLLTTQSGRQPDWERAVIAAAAGAGVARVVKLSVFRADEQSPLRFARQHRQAERALEQSGLPWTLVRPVFLMQNLRAMVRGGAVYTAAGDGRVAMIDARDIAAVAAAALTTPGHEGRIYTLTGPDAVTFDDVASELSRQSGKQIRHVRVSVDDVRTALESAGLAAWFADDMARLHAMLAAGYEDLVTDDVREVTGSPARTLAQFLRDTGGT